MVAHMLIEWFVAQHFELESLPRVRVNALLQMFFRLCIGRHPYDSHPKIRQIISVVFLYPTHFRASIGDRDGHSEAKLDEGATIH